MKLSLTVAIIFSLLGSLVVGPATVEVTNAQVTHFYGRGYSDADPYLNYCSFYITMYSPDKQTTHVNAMPLEFNITWTEYPNFLVPALYGYYAYSIDNGSFIEVVSSQSANDVFYQTSKNNFTINPSFSYLVDISNLEKGYHNIIINASLYNQNRSPPPIYPPDHFYFNITTAPFQFLVGEPMSTPTQQPTIEPISTPNITTTPTLTPFNPSTQQPTQAPNPVSDNTTTKDYIPIITVAAVALIIISVLGYFTKYTKKEL